MTSEAKPTRAGLSLYANLLEPSPNTGTISSAPVRYKQPSEDSPEQDDVAKKQQALAASLRFQPTKRPQVAAQKAKAKAIASKYAPPTTTTTSSPIPPPPPVHDSVTTPDLPTTAAPGGNKTTLADWTATADDDDINLYGEKRQRGGRKKRKKNWEAEEALQDWDDIYDPSRPNNYEEYKNSEEKIREVRDWKDVLYAHRMKRRDSSEDYVDHSDRRRTNKQSAPARTMAFAPPWNNNGQSPPPLPPPPPAPPSAEMPDDPTGEESYVRRLRLSQMQQPPPRASPSLESAARPVEGQILRAPVRYNLPEAPIEIPASEAELEAKLADDRPEPATPEADHARSSRPGQAGFAERLLSKYGWTKGSGLGAQGTGIINPLYAKVDKRKKKPDAEGGGFATPGGTGKILGGQKNKAGQKEEMGKFGAMSEVIKLENMLTGMDLDAELVREEGGIMQEIGEECGEKYGSVQRVYIHRGGLDMERSGPTVFVQFVNQLSALRAVNALEGRVFNGNAIKARFWAQEKFEEEVYD